MDALEVGTVVMDGNKTMGLFTLTLSDEKLVAVSKRSDTFQWQVVDIESVVKRQSNVEMTLRSGRVVKFQFGGFKAKRNSMAFTDRLLAALVAAS